MEKEHSYVVLEYVLLIRKQYSNSADPPQQSIKASIPRVSLGHAPNVAEQAHHQVLAAVWPTGTRGSVLSFAP